MRWHIDYCPGPDNHTGGVLNMLRKDLALQPPVRVHEVEGRVPWAWFPVRRGVV